MICEAQQTGGNEMRIRAWSSQAPVCPTARRTMEPDWSTSRIGMPEMAVPGRRAAGLVTSFAPMTSATSARGNSGLISSISLSCG